MYRHDTIRQWDLPWSPMTVCIKEQSICNASCAGVTAKFGFLFLVKMYMIPYWINVIWLDVVTYLHHTDKEVRLWKCQTSSHACAVEIKSSRIALFQW